MADYNAGALLRDAADPMMVMRRVVDQALSLIGPADGAVVELVGDDLLTYVCTAGTLTEHVGVQVPVDGSLSGLAIASRATLRCDDATVDDRVDRDACERVGLRSMICVPLRRGDDAVGVLKLSSSRPGAFADADLVLLANLAGFISAAIGGWADLARSAEALMSPDVHDVARTQLPAGQQDRPLLAEQRVSSFVANVLQPGSASDAQARQRIENALLHSAIRMHFQPIIDLKTNRVSGYEALARFTDTPARPPDVWFAEAQQVGLGEQLQLLAVGKALDQLPDLPAGVYVAVNVGHDVAAHPDMLRMLRGCDGGRVVVELTEHLQVQDYPALLAAVERIRDLGARVAIDDTGAGFAGFSHILLLAPDLIKLDRVLTGGVDSDPARQALAGALVNFASATRAKVIAEGVETAAELAVIHDLGIDYGQGYHLGRPAPVTDLAHDASIAVHPQTRRTSR